jgi:uncharacterized membrane protein
MYEPANVTSLGLSERVERVLCYSLLWVSGLIMLFIEQRNQTVRRHAKQSIVIFGGLTLLAWLVSVFSGALGWIPLLGGVFDFLFGGLHLVINAVIFGLWLLLMVLAWLSPSTLRLGRWTA